MNSELLRQVMEMVMKAGLRPSMKPSDWLAVLIYLSKKGWLKVFEKDGNVTVATAAYRIKEFNKDMVDNLPKKEEGNILFVPFFLSREQDRMTVPKIIKAYLDENKDIEEIIFEDKNDRIRRFGREINGKKQQVRATSDA